MKFILGRDCREYFFWMGGNRGFWGWIGFLKVIGLVNGGRKMRVLIFWFLVECFFYRIEIKIS